MAENAATPVTPETGYSEDGAAQAILARMIRTPEQPDPEEEAPEAVEAAEPEAEQPEGQADATEDEAEPETEWEIEFAGQTHKMPPGTPEDVARKVQELGKNLHSDYTRKTQEIAETRKAIEAERATAQELLKLTHEHADLVADFRVVQRQIDQLSGEDLMALSESDPLAAQQKMARLMQLQNAQQRIGAQLQQTVSEAQAKQTASAKEVLEKAQAELQKEIRDWGPDTAKAIRDFGKSMGFNDTELSQVTDPRVVKLLWKAQQFESLQKAKPAVTKRVAEAPKTLKAGSVISAKGHDKARSVDTMQRLQKTGRVDDAAAAILARIKRS
jgi:hypothetical protein